MTIANDIIFLSLRNAGVSAIGQTPNDQDANDTFRVLNAWINEINLERTVAVNRTPAPLFPDRTTDVPFWTQYEHVILTAMSVRLRQIYSLPPIQLDVQLAASAIAAFNAIKLSFTPAPTIAADDGTGYGIVYLALRAAGRVSDESGVLQTSQDVTDAHSLLNEMLDEWQRERTVRVIPGVLSPIADLSVPLTLTPGERNAIVLNLACRLRDAFGIEVSKTLADRADRALQLLQAINLQQSPVNPVVDPSSPLGIVWNALRAAGRLTDTQGIDPASQDVSDGHLLLLEMVDEWQRERDVAVNPGELPDLTDLTKPIPTGTYVHGMRNAMTLNLAVRLRELWGQEVPPTLQERATRALGLLQAINLQQSPVNPTIDPTTPLGLIWAALRAAGRLTDTQGIDPASQDVTDAQLLMLEMVDEWDREYEVRVVPGELPDLRDLTTPITGTFVHGMRNAIVLNLAVRLRELWGQEVPASLLARADKAFQLISAINLQQTPVNPVVDPTSPLGLIWLALRAAGRLTDQQGIDPASQDVTDAQLLMLEMVDEWQREFDVRVIPFELPDLRDLTAPIPAGTYVHGMRDAISLNLAVRLRDYWGQEVPSALQARADKAFQLISAINLQQTPVNPVVDPTSPLGIIWLALRAAGRMTDAQGIDPASQDVTDAQLLMLEMVDEWSRQFTVMVNPGELPDLRNLTAPIPTGTYVHGMRNALTLNLAVRLRELWGQEVPATLQERATKALALVSAINQHQMPALHPGPPTTVIQALFLALRMAGRITDTQSVADDSKDVADAFSLLVMMLAQWQRKRWLVWSEQPAAKVSTGANYYTIGTGQDFDLPRPDKIHAAWCRLPPFVPFTQTPGSANPIDISLAIIESMEDWSQIAIKNLQTIPSAVFYESAFPVGRLHFWPIAPAGLYELHIVVKAPLPLYATVNDLLNLPPEYVDAVVDNLACRILVASGQPISSFLLGQARGSLETVKMTNAQIPQLGLPGFLTGVRGSDASSWSGKGLNQAWITGGDSVLS